MREALGLSGTQWDGPRGPSWDVAAVGRVKARTARPPAIGRIGTEGPLRTILRCPYGVWWLLECRFFHITCSLSGGAQARSAAAAHSAARGAARCWRAAWLQPQLQRRAAGRAGGWIDAQVQAVLRVITAFGCRL